jgi:hypothetical protein
VSITLALCDGEPFGPVPVIVTELLPVRVVLLVVTVMADEPEPVTDDGLNDAVAPLGRPLALNDTGPSKPPEEVIVAS